VGRPRNKKKGRHQPLALAVIALSALPPRDAAPRFELVQPELFGVTGGQPNAWADFDNDGDLDEFVGFRGRPNRLYRQDHGRFEDVAAAVGLADNVETRAAARGDFDGDGQVDLYAGFIDGTPNKLYRNDGDGRHFTDVAGARGVLSGVTRQVSWIDYDNDGDLDLFIAVRDQANRLFRNDGGRFTDVTAESGIGDTRKRRRSTGLPGRDTPPDLFGRRRHRRRLLLAERHAVAPRHRERCESGCRGDDDVPARAPADEVARDRSRDRAQALGGALEWLMANG
jgi:hypothetical protein